MKTCFGNTGSKKDSAMISNIVYIVYIIIRSAYDLLNLSDFGRYLPSFEF